ncbi:MAG TPA: beta-N-acetylhexosaminidase [Candidatus Angelobacter sp.]|nr:beta-N-acetylhexosaminidase [Candidatus Angelobacter sp.]
MARTGALFCYFNVAMPTKSNLELRQAAGQTLILGFGGTEPDTQLHATLDSLHPGGVVLFARNIETPAQTWSLLYECQASSPLPMFLCVDMEGGSVDRMKKAIAPVPSARKVFATGDPRLFRAHGEIIGLELRAMGFNTTFAPVLDLGLEASRPVLASRTASADPKQVVRYAKEFLSGLKTAEVLGCGKHFPGLGAANLDSHKERPAVNRSWKKLWEEDLLPYRKLHKKLPLAMISHATYPSVTKDPVSASLSKKWITSILREKIGYQGLIVSDDLEMEGVLASGSIEEVSVETLRAGTDLFMISTMFSHDLGQVWRAYEAVVREAEKDRRFAARMTESALKILKFKRRSQELNQTAAKPKVQAVKMLKKIIQEFSEIVEGAAA